MTHELKIWPEYFEHVALGTKTFEVRNNDRKFCFGDHVILKEWSPERPIVFDRDRMIHGEPRGYTGKELKFKIGYIYPIENDKVIFSLLATQEKGDGE